MSFGFSSGDFVQLAQIAHRIYRNYKAAGGEYRQIARRMRSLPSVFWLVLEEAEWPDSTLFQNDSNAASEISIIADGCKSVLDDIERLLFKYHGIPCLPYDEW